MQKLAAAAAIAASVLFAKAAKLEAQHEGRRAHVYDDRDGCPLKDGIRQRDGKPCIGHPTVGIGMNLDRGGAREAMAAVGADYNAVRSGHVDLTAEQIDTLFRTDLEHAIGSVRRKVADFDDLPEAVQLVLIDMTFNMGSVGFPKMLAAVKRRDWEGMIAEMIDSDWYHQVGDRAKHDIELIRTVLDVAEHPQSLTDEEREKVLAMVSITTDTTIADVLAAHT